MLVTVVVAAIFQEVAAYVIFRDHLSDLNGRSHGLYILYTIAVPAAVAVAYIKWLKK